MSKSQTSQTQQNTTEAGAATEPLSAMFSFWTRMARDGATRLQTLGDEWVAAETAAFERARGAAGEAVRLFSDTLDYGARLSAEWRKLSLDAARRGFEMMEVRG